MIRNQGYFMILECSDCGEQARVVGKVKLETIHNARAQGWSLSNSSLSCWCPECKGAHTAKAKMQVRKG